MRSVIASLVFSLGEAISDCFASLATAKNAAGLLRFARSDPYYVTARSYFRLRSGLDRQESLRASLFRLAKQSPLSPCGNTRLLRFARSDPYYVTARSYFRFRSSLRDSSPLRGFGMTDEECLCEVVVSFPKQSHLLRSCRRGSTNSTTSLAIATACSAASFVYTRAGIFSASPLG